MNCKGALLCSYEQKIKRMAIGQRKENMENAKKLTKEEKAKIAEEKRVARRLAFLNGHFCFLVYEEDSKGILRERHDVVNPYFDEEKKAVVFCLSPLNFSIFTDNLEGGIFSYNRCKTRETSPKYGRMAKYAKAIRKAESEDAEILIEGFNTIDEIIAKCHNVKAAKPITQKMMIESVNVAIGRANTVHRNHVKAEERTAKKEAEAQAV